MESLLVLNRSRSSDSNSIDRKSEDALLKAALDGDLAGLKGIIKSLGIENGDGAAVFAINKDDFGVLHCSSRWGHLEVCKYLVEELGGDVNMPAAEGVTPFMASVQYDDISIVKYFLDHGGDPMKADEKGRAVLHHAVRTRSCKVIEFLLSRGVPGDMDLGRGTPLYHAVISEQDKIVKILLDHHANLNSVFIGVGTPLMAALLHRSLDCMKLLIEAGADVNGKGSIVSPLLIATQQGGYTDFIRLLLEAGADPNISDDLGRLPIELAALYDCREEVEMLFPLTSPIPNVRNWSIDGVISHAKLNNAKPMCDDISTVKYFLDHGGDPMKEDEKGRTVLHHAVSTGSCKVIEFLLSRGVPVDMDLGRGTPLYHAVTSDQDKIVKILLDHHANAGADVNGKGSILSPLLIATEQGGYTNFIPFLLKAGADPNICDDLVRLPIELAALNGCREEVEMLFPLTLPIPNVPNWSIDGVITHANLDNAKPMIEGRKAILKSEAGKAFRRKDYDIALAFYNVAINLAPDAALYSNRSICKSLMGDGEGALSDAYQSKTMRPGWAKTCYRQAMAHAVLEEYKEAGDAILEAQELDPETEDIEIEIRKVNEAMTISPDDDEL